MIPAYDKIYLKDVKSNLGVLFDIAVNVAGTGCGDISERFSKSYVAHGIEEGNPRCLCGMSGTEMLSEILGCRVEPAGGSSSRSPEFWAGWILAQLQWRLDRPFGYIFGVVPFERLVSMYHPCHEADDDQVVDKLCGTYFSVNALKSMRLTRRLSQRDLADFSGVSVRTIQSYEQGAVDLRKAEAETVHALAKALGCPMEELLR